MQRKFIFALSGAVAGAIIGVLAHFQMNSHESIISMIIPSAILFGVLGFALSFVDNAPEKDENGNLIRRPPKQPNVPFEITGLFFGTGYGLYLSLIHI